jgi:hypothetical protein
MGESIMKSRFLAENRWLLTLCAGAARFVGLLALSAPVVLIALFAVAWVSGAMGRMPKSAYGQILCTLPMIAFYGFLALVFSEFISYLLAEEGEPKWILRHGSKVIYAYIPYSIAMTIYMVHRTANAGALRATEFYSVMNLSLLIVSTAVRLLIWVGIALVLQKVVPIIRESKTLV